MIFNAHIPEPPIPLAWSKLSLKTHLIYILVHVFCPVVDYHSTRGSEEALCAHFNVAALLAGKSCDHFKNFKVRITHILLLILLKITTVVLNECRVCS